MYFKLWVSHGMVVLVSPKLRPSDAHLAEISDPEEIHLEGSEIFFGWRLTD